MTPSFPRHYWDQLSIEEQAEELFKHMPPGDINEATEMITGLIEAKNAAPQTDLGGLTPHQVHDLLSGDWEPTTPGVRLRTAIPPDLVAETMIVHRAQGLLASLGDQGTPTTAKGNLNREFVARMVAELDFDDKLLEAVRKHRKVINESDVRALEELRLVLGLAGLVRKHRRRFVLTKKGRELKAVERAGDLYRLLLLTTCQRFNLAYRDRLPELPEFQYTLGFSLCQLGRLPEGWHDLDEGVCDFILPSVRLLIPQLPYLDAGTFIVQVRLLDVLEPFGMVEFRDKATQKDPEGWQRTKPLEFRRTPLFGAVFTFGG